ncbi:MAG: type II toxin-antitoxin system Phd/YefM family antitoxin [Cyanobacteria bacterium M_surface_10_m2_119]|nr:type II toxin-antitoxin system Phd/YefM family antitoxin [Cyanobacteria bacterium M_surface_10_m2_119]
MTTTISSREFNQDAAGAKRAALDGPVFITDRGRPAHVLLSIDDYRRLSGEQRSLVDLLAMADDVEFTIPSSRELAQPAELD